jgi:4a-hydroxytetrahydrobiopterin dehydratase
VVMTDTRLSDTDIEAAQLTDWRPLFGALHGRFRTDDFADGLRFVEAVGVAAGLLAHHPDVDLRQDHVTMRLTSRDVQAITDRDVALARRISGRAADLGLVAEPARLAAVELALDTPDLRRVKPFWAALLGGPEGERSDDEVRDADGDLPTIWFQPSGSDEPRQRFHLDVRVPRELARQRIDEVVAAGGVVVDEQATFIVLADADGNKACVCF